MKKEKNFVKVVIVLVVITMLLSFSTVSSFANESKENLQIKTAKNEQMSITGDEEISSPDTESEKAVEIEKRTLTASFDRTKQLRDEKVQVQFDKTGVKNYYYEFEGLSVVETSDSSLMAFEILSTEAELGRIDVYADYGDGELIKSSVYTYSIDDFVYLSDISQDQAWYDCMFEKYSQGLLSLDEFQDEYDSFTRRYCVVEDNSSNVLEQTQQMATDIQSSLSALDSGKITVQGKIRWETSATGNILPMRQTRIELRDDQLAGSRLIATTYTDLEGNYSFEIDSSSEWYNIESDGLDLFVKWYTDSYTFEVGADWTFFNYSFSSRVEENVPAGENVPFDYCTLYNESLSGCKAVYVQQGMVLTQRFAYSMGMETDNFIHVAYPGSLLSIDIDGDGEYEFNAGIEADSAFCWGNVANNCFSAIGLNSWINIDTITHEYGHFVQNSIGTYGNDLLDIIMYNPEHIGNEEMFTEKSDKAFAMDLVWSESWATVFSQIAQEMLASEYVGITNLPVSLYNVETYTFGDNTSEFEENAVTAFLYDLYDDGIYEISFDDISLSAQNWWNYTTRANAQNLTDFSNVIDTYYSHSRAQIGELWSYYKFSVASVSITNAENVWEKQAPELSWIIGGSEDHPNNMFQIACFDEWGNYIAQTTYFSTDKSRNSIMNHTIPTDVWKNILMNTEDVDGETEIVFSVKAYREDDFNSGPYYSQHVTLVFDRNVAMNLTESTRYAERVVNVPQGEYRDIYLSFEVGGINIVQTFGTNFPFIYLYDMQGVLLKTSMEDGYGTNALFSYNFAADTLYILRVEYFKTAHFGDVRVAVTPSAERFNNYEAFDSVTDTVYSYSGSLTYNDSFIFTFNSGFDKTVTFITNASFDSYMYIIDPTSVELVSWASGSASMEDDDSAGGYNARIEKNISANVDYLIIITPYNPSDESGVVTVYFI